MVRTVDRFPLDTELAQANGFSTARCRLGQTEVLA
jgi:hypothetical protein